MHIEVTKTIPCFCYSFALKINFLLFRELWIRRELKKQPKPHGRVTRTWTRDTNRMLLLRCSRCTLAHHRLWTMSYTRSRSALKYAHRQMEPASLLPSDRTVDVTNWSTDGNGLERLRTPDSATYTAHTTHSCQEQRGRGNEGCFISSTTACTKKQRRH